MIKHDVCILSANLSVSVDALMKQHVIKQFAGVTSDPPGIRTQDPRLKRAMLYLLS